MNVAELREALSRFPGDAVVYVGLTEGIAHASKLTSDCFETTEGLCVLIDSEDD